tara:strand:+ start:77 stop:265 length:189 start_codon:yes stop_codon:yes gene_type:complete
MKKNKKVNKIINKIESTRSKNNINWMDILRIAMKHSPKETQKALKKINNQDQKISKLLRKIT